MTEWRLPPQFPSFRRMCRPLRLGSESKMGSGVHRNDGVEVAASPRHSGGCAGHRGSGARAKWVPAFAGMTEWRLPPQFPSFRRMCRPLRLGSESKMGSGVRRNDGVEVAASIPIIPADAPAIAAWERNQNGFRRTPEPILTFAFKRTPHAACGSSSSRGSARGARGGSIDTVSPVWVSRRRAPSASSTSAVRLSTQSPSLA